MKLSEILEQVAKKLDILTSPTSTEEQRIEAGGVVREALESGKQLIDESEKERLELLDKYQRAVLGAKIDDLQPPRPEPNKAEEGFSIDGWMDEHADEYRKEILKDAD